MNWGPWDGGMVTSELKKMFESEGVAVIPLEVGARYLADELSVPPGGPVELVILGSSQSPSQPKTVVPHAKRMVSPEAPLESSFSQTISVDALPILASHIINGRAVVPVALMIEWFAHGAMHHLPGMKFAGFEDLRIFKGITLDNSDHLDAQLLAGSTTRNEGIEQLPVELRIGNTLHARAMVCLGSQHDATDIDRQPAPTGTYALDPYKDDLLFHGPPCTALFESTDATKQGSRDNAPGPRRLPSGSASLSATPGSPTRWRSTQASR